MKAVLRTLFYSSNKEYKNSFRSFTLVAMSTLFLAAAILAIISHVEAAESSVNVDKSDLMVKSTDDAIPKESDVIVNSLMPDCVYTEFENYNSPVLAQCPYESLKKAYIPVNLKESKDVLCDSSVKSDRISRYRKEINGINLQILKLLSQRGELAKKIGEEKNKQGLDIYDPKREKEVIDQILLNNTGPFDDRAIKNIFEEIFKASRDLQKQ